MAEEELREVTGIAQAMADPAGRARELLLSLLDDKQRAMYEEHNVFVAVGNVSGNHYLIFNTPSYNVFDLSAGWRYCAISANGVPFYDTLASQLLMIECEEEAFHRVANQGSQYDARSMLRWLSVDRELADQILAEAPVREVAEVPKPATSRRPRYYDAVAVGYAEIGLGGLNRILVDDFGPAMVREPPRPIQITVSGPCTLRNYNLVHDLRQSGNCISIEETGSLLAGPTEFRAVLVLDTMAGVNTLLNELRRYEGLSIFGENIAVDQLRSQAFRREYGQQFPEDQEWQDCSDPDCPTCREYREYRRQERRHQLRMEELITISGDVNAPYEARWQATRELQRM